jgi:hypothetical protein
MIVPCTLKPMHSSRFTLSAWATKDVLPQLRIGPVDPRAQWKCAVRKDGEWLGTTAGGTVTHPTWAANPTYVLKVAGGTTRVGIVLGRLPAGKNAAADAKKTTIGFHVLGATDDDDDVVATSEWTAKATIAVELSLKNGEYRIRPSTHEPKHEMPFRIRVFADHEVTLGMQ